MKKIGYRIFAICYQLFSKLPIKENTAFLVMTHDDGPEGNVAVAARYFKRQFGTTFWKFRRKDTDFSGVVGLCRAFAFFICRPIQMARAQYVFMDNAFLPMAHFKVRKDTTVVQLWHGTGTIKKFGQDANEGELYDLEQAANENLDYIIVSSESTRKLYAGCFGVPEDKVKVLGLPRTDILFSMDVYGRRREKFYKEYPQLKDKKLVLYAPTFRDQEAQNPKVHLDLQQMTEQLPEDYVLGLRLHPFVADNFTLPEEYVGQIYDFSNYDSLNTLLMVTDVLISDYSSIVFEYCVFKRPMIFYAYDLEEFSDNGRGFYEDYESYVPGPVVRNTEELLEAIVSPKDYTKRIEEFYKKTYQYEDGQSTKRLAKLLRQ